MAAWDEFEETNEVTYGKQLGRVFQGGLLLGMQHTAMCATCV